MNKIKAMLLPALVLGWIAGAEAQSPSDTIIQQDYNVTAPDALLTVNGDLIGTGSGTMVATNAGQPPIGQWPLQQASVVNQQTIRGIDIRGVVAKIVRPTSVSFIGMIGWLANNVYQNEDAVILANNLADATYWVNQISALIGSTVAQIAQPEIPIPPGFYASTLCSQLMEPPCDPNHGNCLQQCDCKHQHQLYQGGVKFCVDSQACYDAFVEDYTRATTNRSICEIQNPPEHHWMCEEAYMNEVNQANERFRECSRKAVRDYVRGINKAQRDLEKCHEGCGNNEGVPLDP